MGNRRRLALLVALALVAIGAAVAVALAAGHPFSQSAARRRAREPGSAVNRGPAIADARRRLRSFVPPPHSHRVHSLPRSLGLTKPFETLESPRFISVHDFWVSQEPVEGVRTYLRTHTPPGASHNISDAETGRGNTIYRWDYVYGWPERPKVADNRELLVGVVARPGGGTALRVDAEATYVEPKPKGQQIPTGAGYLEAVEVLGSQVRVAGTASAAKIEATAKLIDGLPIIQEDGAVECGAIPSERVTLKGIFRASRGGRILAETEQELPAGYCDFIGLTIEGKEARGLYDEDEGLVKALQNLLGRKYKQPLLAGIEEL